MDFHKHLSDVQLPVFRNDNARSDPAIMPGTETEPPQALAANKRDVSDDASMDVRKDEGVAAVDRGTDQGTRNPPEKREIVIEPWFEDLEMLDKSEGAVIVNPITTERFYWTDPLTDMKREIWRPGDGDGDKMVDYYEKLGQPVQPEQRWRFYQSRTGSGAVRHEQNEPPKYVILDDRAAQEVLISNIPRTHIQKFWPHEFGGNGFVRARRPHRGRGAIGDLEATGPERFHFTFLAGRKDGERYYFTGEPNYKPVVWNTNDYDLAIGVFKPEVKKPTSLPTKDVLKWNQHGHNQFTPAKELVKFGAPRKGTSYREPKNLRNEPDGGVRGGRNRVQPLASKNLDSPAPSPKSEADELWRNNARSPADAEREAEILRGFAPRGSGKKRRLNATSAEGETEETEETDAYIKSLEKFLVKSKLLTDDQHGQIRGLKRQLSEAKKVIKGLEAEVEVLKGE